MSEVKASRLALSGESDRSLGGAVKRSYPEGEGDRNRSDPRLLQEVGDLTFTGDRNEQLANALASLANNLRYKELLALTEPRHA